jgi:hypothetical protein
MDKMLSVGDAISFMTYSGGKEVGVAPGNLRTLWACKIV